MGDLSDFWRGQIVGACLAGASVTKMATLLGVSTAAVSTVMTVYTNLGKTSSAKRNSCRKPKLSERVARCTLKRIVSEYHRTTAAKVTVELNIHLENPVSTKIVWQELHISSIHGRAVIAKPLITENNAKRLKRWCDDHKTWTSDDWKYKIWSEELYFTLFPTSSQVCLENAQESLYFWMPVSNCETLRWICDDLGSITLAFCWS